MKIAVYTIALNEEQFVERWYESAKDADYLMIADTGSTDRTVELAKSLGITVHTISVKPWRFDDARNAALSLLPDDIDMCVSLDMDELLVEGWRDAVESINENTTRPRYQYTWNFIGDNPGLQFGGDHIHARHGYRWKHPVHEVLVPDRMTEVQEWINLEIHHKADDSKSRGQYLPLLELSITEDPLDSRNAFYYARELYFYKRYEEAITEFKRYLSLPTSKWKAERGAAYRYIAEMDPENAREHLLNSLKEDSNRRETFVELAYVAYTKEDWPNVLHWCEAALAIKEKPLDYLAQARAWGPLVHDLYSIALYYSGNKESAIKEIKKALEMDPTDQRLIGNLLYFTRN